MAKNKNKNKHKHKGDISKGIAIEGNVKIHDINAPTGNIGNSVTTRTGCNKYNITADTVILPSENPGISPEDGRSVRFDADSGNNPQPPPSIGNGVLKLILLCVCALVITFIVYKLVTGHVLASNGAAVQKFYVDSNNTTRAGISYIEYTVIPSLHLDCYYVQPYPYLVYVKEGEDRIIPIKNLFTQDEYVSDPKGGCTLLQEDMELLQDFIDNTPALSRSDCLLVILYVEDAREVRKVYELRNGELAAAEEDIVIRVLEAYENADNVSIDMTNWPLNLEEIEEMISE